jgi:hypothetical protein
MQFKSISSVNRYELEWKLVEHDWSSPAGKTALSAGGKPKIQVEATELTPGMTYCLRAYCVDASSGSKGAAGPELIIDTEQVGCTPKAEKSCCTIQ